MTTRFTRRKFLQSSATIGAFTILPGFRSLGAVSPNERINLAVIGIGHQGFGDRRAMLGSGLCDVVALCDIDMQGEHTHKARYIHGLTNTPPPITEKEIKQAKERGEQPPSPPAQLKNKARGFTDFRVMFDQMADEIDAVLIATPDHAHFAAAMLAMSLGKHVYVEKPLAHTFGQCERLMEMEKRSGVVTQMGNQGHSGANYFQFKAWREAGIVKDITHITSYCNNWRRWHGWGQDVTAYPTDPMPKGIEWDQWHDVVGANRPFSRRLHPQEWRSWFEFGSGAFGDWGPHILDTCHRFLELGLPGTITSNQREGTNELVYPQATVVQFDFPERGEDLPACTVTWNDGNENFPEVIDEWKDRLIDPKTGKTMWIGGAGKMLYSKDMAFKGGHHAQPLQIVPREKYIEMHDSLPDYPQKNSNHYTNFLRACKGEEEARSPFSISGPLTQVFNLGVIAQRLGGELKFDRKKKVITNNNIAQSLLDPKPRPGWEEFYQL
ncbi:MAG: Gfo/Idh/MocA family oxidoreductase [Coraliomargaritaceae bacterium]